MGQLVEMKREVDIRKYYPEILKDIREFEEYAVAINPEFQLLVELKEKSLHNQYLLTCDEDGIARYEKWLKIQPPATASLEDRRLAVLMAWNISSPFTEKRLIEMLDAICGKGMYVLTVKPNEYYVEVTLQLAAKKTGKPAADMLERILPLHLIYHVDLFYNTFADLHRYTHGELAVYTHRELREEVLK